ncbi:MAG: glycerol-3-phosphate 1-O-acyltransferase PlsY [Deltaproteobacteria bacterium]|jgi:glycerol-3-phosphate acyltransferase PlsY|nr:glycerol-3-phosphate 1-O-acyltransferase PlsY [Deltaproteobacteria bacterium]MDA8158366.1 glycerol-3-phosphate 1-O-acyltransferase PlsY [Deltaproteobacteria bacterium]
MYEIFFIFGAYLIGSFPTSAIIAKLKGVPDLTKKGSGNLGATNVSRVIGKKFGLITLLIDAGKGFLPVFLAIDSFRQNGYALQFMSVKDLIFLSLIIIAPVAGHCFSIFIKFKGGKGVATGLGVFLAVSPEAVLIAFLIFLAILFSSKYVSLASTVSAFFMPFLIFYTLKNIYIFVASIFIAALIIYKHYPNIKRLVNGTENRIKK